MLANGNGETVGIRSVALGRAAAQSTFFTFSAVPRRTATLRLVLSDATPAVLELPNPLFGQFPQWQADSAVPAVKTAGNLQVCLNNFLTDAYRSQFRTNQRIVTVYRPAHKGEVPHTAFDVSVKSSPGQPRELWEIHRATLSDATGNLLLADPSPPQPAPALAADTQEWVSFRGALWPDESAWRLRLELKRTVSSSLEFMPEELVTFRNVPVLASSATNTLWFTNTERGVQVVLCEFVREPGSGVSFGFNSARLPKFHAECPGDPGGASADFLEATSVDRGRLQTQVVGRSATVERGQFATAYYSVALRPPDDRVAAVDITCVVQKTRAVEFLLRPPPTLGRRVEAAPKAGAKSP
jgi:hypothetical protein